MSLETDPKHLPVLFLGHGSPMLALEDGPWHSSLRRWASEHEVPQTILVISAHWETPHGFRLTTSAQPGVLHDFSGFDPALYGLDYPAPGNPTLAEEIASDLRAKGLRADLDTERPLDHGAWVPLRALYPGADIPVLQMSIPAPRTHELLLEAGKALTPLRGKGVLILASGGLVHNLRRLDWSTHPAPETWATEFENWVMKRLEAGDHEDFARTVASTPGYALAVPTSEHFDPIFVALGAAGSSSPATLFEGWQHGNLSLRALQF
jgi:4,5-DOPA dioxygenase extradiol